MDEVENLSIETQRMLLRAMEELRYRPVGGQRDRLMDVRIIAATNEDLQEAVALSLSGFYHHRTCIA